VNFTDLPQDADALRAFLQVRLLRCRLGIGGGSNVLLDFTLALCIRGSSSSKVIAAIIADTQSETEHGTRFFQGVAQDRGQPIVQSVVFAPGAHADALRPSQLEDWLVSRAGSPCRADSDKYQSSGRRSERAAIKRTSRIRRPG
jgi:hypothetical protein